MVIDRLENLEKYASLNPLFPKVVEFLKNTDLASHEAGKVFIQDKDLFANFTTAKGKKAEGVKTFVYRVHDEPNAEKLNTFVEFVSKLGFKMTAKSVWLIYGAVMALALILMIFAFSRPVGYCLAAGVFASVLAVVIMRAYQACFTALTNNASLFGKVK